jgi:tellurite resistance protein
MSDLDQAKKELSEELGSPKVEALVEAMFLAATADGEFAPEEALQFSATIGALTDKKLDPDVVHRLIGQLSLRLKSEGRQARLGSIAQRLPAGKPRETAIILAAAITASDGEVKSSENDLVAELADVLGVDPERAIELVQKVHGSR